jgi:hypothetical protein
VLFNKRFVVLAEKKHYISVKLVYAERKEVLLSKQEVFFAVRKKMI